MRTMKRWFWTLAAVLAVTAALTLGASAAEIVDSGTCGAQGNNVTWTLDSEGTLTISGAGEMADYDYDDYYPVSLRAPWYNDRAAIKGVVIGEGVTSIGRGAFLNCNGLTGMTVLESVTCIEGGAFYGCTGLTSVTIPEGVTSIGLGAFYGCVGLTSLTVPGSAILIGEGAFEGCTGLMSAGPIGGGYNIEFGWTESIPAFAFSHCNGLTSVTIPEGVTSIGAEAFVGCTSLASLTIPGSVTYMDGVFSNPNPMDVNDLYNSLTSAGPIRGGYDYEFGWTEHIPAHAFLDCNGLTSVMIPEGVTCIERGAFYGCTGLTSVTIPEGVTCIEGGAFYGCTGLTSVTIPESVTCIEGGAFYGCTGLTSAGPIGGGYDFEFGWTESIPANVFCGTGLTSVTIPESVRSIGDAAFFGTGLTSVTIPESVTSIGADVFEYCSALTDIYYGGGKKAWRAAGGPAELNNGKTRIHYGVSHTVTASAGEHGTIDPSGAVSVYEGESQRFIVVPDEGYKTTLTVDGVTVLRDGAVIEDALLDTDSTVYYGQAADSLFYYAQAEGGVRAGTALLIVRDIEADRDIAATFTSENPEPAEYTVTYAPNGGTGEKAPVTVTEGGTITLPGADTFAPPAGMAFKAWSVNGAEYAPGDTVAVTGDMTVTAVWEKKPEDPKPPAPAETDKKLDDLVNDLTAAGEDIRKALEGMSGEIAGAVKELGGQIFDKIAELEKRLEGGSATVEVEAGLGFASTHISVTGAKLNFDYSKSVSLKVGKPENPDIQVPEAPAGQVLTRFSMKLVEGANNNVAELTVPIRVTLPVPAQALKGQTLKIWHFHKGKLVPVTLTSRPFQEDGQWYVSFMVSGFSDFIMSYETEEAVTAALSPDGKRVDFTDPAGLLDGGARVIAARYEENGALADLDMAALPAGESAAAFTRALGAGWRLFLLDPETGAPLCGGVEL